MRSHFVHIGNFSVNIVNTFFCFTFSSHFRYFFFTNVCYNIITKEKKKAGRIEMKKVCVFIWVVCLILIVGLIGGVENGQPLENLLWCIPLSAVSVASVWISSRD